MKKTVQLIAVMVAVSTLVTAQAKRETLTNQKIIELARLGLGDAVIVAKVQQSVCDCDTSVEAIAKLKAARISDAVIVAMLNMSGGDQNYSDSSPLIDSRRPAVESRSAGKVEAVPLNRLTEPGIYLYEGGQFKAIEPSIFSGSKVNPFMSSLTMGVMKTKIRAKVRGRAANMQIRGGVPTFYFVFNTDYKNSGAVMSGTSFLGMSANSPAEFLLVQMNVKQASREAVLGEVGAFTGVSMGARDEDVREYSFEKVTPGVYKVVPRSALPAGEYSFYYAGNVTGVGLAGGKVFDFSIAAN
jgi:hypothetical protein